MKKELNPLCRLAILVVLILSCFVVAGCDMGTYENRMNEASTPSNSDDS